MVRLKVSAILLLTLAVISAACVHAPAIGSAPTAAQAVMQPQPSAEMPVRREKHAGESQPTPATLTVLAAASLTEAFTEIGRIFESQNPGVQVEFSFAGSQQLTQQLDHGAPADVFASASNKHMDAAIQSGRVTVGEVKIFANNRLVVIYPKDNPAGLKALRDLAMPGLKLILAAREVPVGQYSLDFLDKATQNPAFGPMFKVDVLKNVVSYEENVKAVLTKIVLAEADAGIVYLSDVSADAAPQVGNLDIPVALNVIASYPIAPIHDSQNPGMAQAFVDFVLSPAGQKVLEKYNFVPMK